MKMLEVKHLLTAGLCANDSILLIGVHGIGKSDVVRDWAIENNIHIETLFLSNQEPADLIGIPHINNGVTQWAEPSWMSNLHKHAFPECVLDDLIFHDKDFEKYVLDNINKL